MASLHLSNSQALEKDLETSFQNLIGLLIKTASSAVLISRTALPACAACCANTA